jgi:hypothetical protein
MSITALRWAGGLSLCGPGCVFSVSFRPAHVRVRARVRTDPPGPVELRPCMHEQRDGRGCARPASGACVRVCTRACGDRDLQSAEPVHGAQGRDMMFLSWCVRVHACACACVCVHARVNGILLSV